MKAPGLSEAQIERQILDYLVKIRKVLAWKNISGGYFDVGVKRFRKHASPYARNGAPDIIAVVQGRFIGLEVKKKGGSQSEAQKAFESDLRLAGGLYYIVRSLEEVDDIFTLLLPS